MQALLSLEEAFAAVTAVASQHPLPLKRMPLAESVGYVLAKPAIAELSIPPFDNSARDGFVVDASVSAGADWYSVNGEIRAGDTVEHANGIPPKVARIMTGGPIPVWADAVVMLEHATLDGTQVRFDQAIEKGSWLRAAGSDIAAGDSILGVGRRIVAEHIQALASSGIRDVEVFVKPRVAVVSTGEELVDLATGTLQSGQIFDSNRPSMSAQVQAFGAELALSEHVGDSLEAMVEFLHKAMDSSLDLVVSSGAVSMGSYDFVRPALEAVGASIHFHKVAQKPGKPLLFATLPNGTLYFGLPGNPVSSTVNCRFYVHHALAVMQRMAKEQPLQLSLVSNVKTSPQMATFLKAKVIQGTEGPAALALEGQESFQTRPLLEMNGWILIPAGCGGAAAGDRVSCYPAHTEALPAIE